MYPKPIIVLPEGGIPSLDELRRSRRRKKTLVGTLVVAAVVAVVWLLCWTAR